VRGAVLGAKTDPGVQDIRHDLDGESHEQFVFGGIGVYVWLQLSSTDGRHLAYKLWAKCALVAIRDNKSFSARTILNSVVEWGAIIRCADWGVSHGGVHRLSVVWDGWTISYLTQRYKDKKLKNNDFVAIFSMNSILFVQKNVCINVCMFMGMFIGMFMGMFMCVHKRSQ